MLRTLVTSLALLGLAAHAGAGTKYQTNLVPTPADCFGGLGQCLNNGASCNDPQNDSDCMASGMSPRSTVTFDGRQRLKFSIRGVKDNTGALVTTGPEGAADNYVLDLEVRSCVPGAGEIPYCTSATIPGWHIYIKVVLNGGIGKGKIDLHPVVIGAPFNYPAGESLVVTRVTFVTPHGCAGTNSPTDIAARANGPCNDGVGVLGVPGVLLE